MIARDMILPLPFNRDNLLRKKIGLFPMPPPFVKAVKPMQKGGQVGDINERFKAAASKKKSKATGSQIATAIKQVYAEARKDGVFAPPAAARAVAMARLAGDKNAKFDPARLKTITVRRFK